MHEREMQHRQRNPPADAYRWVVHSSLARLVLVRFAGFGGPSGCWATSGEEAPEPDRQMAGRTRSGRSDPRSVGTFERGIDACSGISWKPIVTAVSWLRGEFRLASRLREGQQRLVSPARSQSILSRSSRPCVSAFVVRYLSRCCSAGRVHVDCSGFDGGVPSCVMKNVRGGAFAGRL
jgi:hypothetical protein